MRLFSRTLLTVLLLAVVLIIVFALLANPRPLHPYFDEKLVEDSDVWVLAHQGGDGLAPSNTLLAFERSVTMGADVLELDLHTSSDGELVVIHDDTLDRTTSGAGPVNALTLAEIKALDAGYHWSPERLGESFPYRDRGITVPTLKEVFEAFPDTRINLEIKQTDPSIVNQSCALIREYGRETSVLMSAFYDDALAEFRRICPEVATSAGPNEVRLAYILHRLYLSRLYTPQADAFQIPQYQGALHLAKQRFIGELARKNVRVQVWTINETADMERLLDAGVQGLNDRQTRPRAEAVGARRGCGVA